MGLDLVAVGAVASAPGIGVAQREQRGAVPVVRRRQRVHQVAPAVAAFVEDRRDAELGESATEEAVTDLERIGLQLRHECVVGRARVARHAKGADGVLRAGDEGVVQEADEPGVAVVQGQLAVGVVRADRAVQDGSPNALGKQVRVDRAEIGAVGVPEVGDLFDAQRLANAVEVACGTHRVDVVEDVTAARGTGG